MTTVPSTVFTDFKIYPVTILLIDDQPIIAETIRQMLATEEDIVFHYCQEPEKALQTAIKIRPTVILQDLVMPNIDGLTLLQKYQENSEIRNIPIIILSTKEDPLIKAKAFTLGAADYIVKLPDKIEFIARIRHHSEAFIRLLERNDAYMKLVESQVMLSSELYNAAVYVTSLLPLPLNGDIEATWRYIPSAQLGGDTFGYQWLDGDNFVFYLLDVCGHGVGAALLSVTVANVIRSQSQVNIDFRDPSQVLKRLNEMFPMEKHNNMFFTIWYGIYNKKTRQLKYSTGGHPPAILYNLKESPTNPTQLSTQGIVIGAIPEASYTNAYCQIPFNNRLFLFSDGVYEIKNSSDTMITISEFVNCLDHYVKDSQNDLDKIVHAARQLQDGQMSFMDDFSILEFTFR